MKRVLLILTSLLFTISLAYADHHGKGMNKGSDNGQMMKSQNSMNGNGDMTKKSGNKPSTMSCGAGKCGGSKMDKSGSCGAGKCGNGDFKPKKTKKPSGSCGAGK